MRAGRSYFQLEPLNSLSIAEARDWDHLAALAATGIVASVFAEQRRRIRDRLADSNRKRSTMLESISDGFNALDHEWRYTYVNAAGARLVGKTPQELVGKNFWKLWPEAVDSPFGTAYRRAVAENVPVQVEAFFEPLNAWFEVRCYPSPEGLSLFFTNTTEHRHAQEQLRLLESAAIADHRRHSDLESDGRGRLLPGSRFRQCLRLSGSQDSRFEDSVSGALPQIYNGGV